MSSETRCSYHSLPPLHNTAALFSALNWIPIADLVKCKNLKLLFSILVNPDAPVCLRQKIDFLKSSRYATRGSTANNLKVKQPRTNFDKSCFSFSAALLFNSLNSDIKNLASSPLSWPSSLAAFQCLIKRKLREVFLSKLKAVSHLEDLCCHTCRYHLKCRCLSV